MGNAVDQDAARLLQGFEDGDVVAFFHQLACHGNAGGTGADDGDLVSVRRFGFDGLKMIFPGVVGGVAFQFADAHGIAFFAQDAVFFALAFLGTDAAANGGQCRVLGKFHGGGLGIVLGDFVDEGGDVHGDGASLHALRHFTV